MQFINGGLTAAEGFAAAGIHCGVKTKNMDKKDLALVFSEKPCVAAAMYTQNVVKAAPILITMEHLKNGRAQAVIVNSGNANACAEDGGENALRMCAAAGKSLGIPASDVIVASTGVIGQSLTDRMSVIEGAVPALKSSLSKEGGSDAAEAIMTTDLVKKECAVSLTLGGKAVTIGGMTKGSGMIHPNMGTMLCFITTDAAISPQMLDKALRHAVKVSFNRISVDGDTSTNDMCSIMANSMAGNPEISENGSDFQEFQGALETLCVYLARKMAADGEGAKHLITCTVSGAESEQAAEILGKSVISSSLLKAAIFGEDANWGRVLCAMGYSGAGFDPDLVNVAFSSGAGRVQVCSSGRGLLFSEELAKKILCEKEVVIDIDLGSGPYSVTCWGCDLTYDYVKINGDYRT